MNILLEKILNGSYTKDEKQDNVKKYQIIYKLSWPCGLRFCFCALKD